MDTDKSIDQILLEEFPAPTWEEWLKAAEDTLKGADFSKVMKTKTYEGISLNPIYRKEDLEKLSFLLSEPGIAPYLRGNDPEKRLRESWLVAQAQEEEDLGKLNEVILDELSRGLSAVNLILKTSDRKQGIVIGSAHDFGRILKGVDLKAAPLLIQADLEQVALLEHFQTYCREEGIDLKSLEGSIGFDPTGELARKGSLPMDLHPAWYNLLKAVKWALEHAPHLRVISIDTRCYESAGATAVQELGFALSTAIGYLDGLLEAGLTIEQVAPLFQVKLSLGSNLFMEIAKLRAFRLLWAEMIKEFGGGDAAQKIWIHARTACFNKSTFDIYTNVLRSSTETFAGVLGGADSLEVDPFDALLKTSDEFSRRIARNQQILMGEEAHLNKVIDPAAGSYYVESLTGQLSEAAWKLMQELETEGGMIKALLSGKVHSRLAEVSKARIDAVNKRKDVFVGVNMFANPDEKAVSLRTMYQSPEKQVVKLSEGALPVLRACMDIEALRNRVLGTKPENNLSVCMVNVGSLAVSKPRLDFAIGFFQAGSLDVINPGFFDTASEAIAAAKASGASSYCICGTDESYLSVVPEVCAALGDKALILAGYPADQVESYKQAGIDVFIHIRANLFDTLSELVNLMEVKK